jgi:thiamine-monophosphate kinase
LDPKQSRSNPGTAAAPAKLGEDGIIARYFAPFTAGLPGAYMLQDDAAAIAVPPGHDLVVTTDALIAGVHFFPDDDPGAIAWKALAVNVSDLAAKAATPIAYSLALALTRSTDEAWLTGFAGGLGAAQAMLGICLSGGDTTSSPAGPLMVSITAFGSVPAGRMVRRGGAKPGDGLFVTGTIGDGALGLAVRAGSAESAAWPLSGESREALLKRYLYPMPSTALRDALLAHADAAMDISDGLAMDCSRMCKASRVSARIEAARVPLSDAARAVLAANPALLETVLTGGDDYEILAAIRPGEEDAFMTAAASSGVAVTKVGTVEPGVGDLAVVSPDGTEMHLTRLGYDHLAHL